MREKRIGREREREGEGERERKVKDVGGNARRMRNSVAISRRGKTLKKIFSSQKCIGMTLMFVWTRYP